jgi:TonB family protein
LAGLLLGFTAVTPAATWLETRAEIEQLAEAEDFDAAVELGSAYLDSVRETFGETSEQMVDAHLLLGDVNRGKHDLLEAEAHYIAAIGLIEDAEGPFSPRLMEPYTELGESYSAAHEFELAMAAFEEAQSISRRALGILNQQQLGVLERMSLAALGIGDFDRAKDIREDMANLTRRYYGPGSVEALDASFEYAEWLSDYGDFRDARYVYIDIQDVIDDYFDEDPKLTIKRLRIVSDKLPTAAVVGGRVAQPVELNQALKLVANLDEPDPELHAEVLLDLGDWYVARRGDDHFQDFYRDAWDLLGSVDNGESLRRQWFSDLVVLRSGPLVSHYLTLDETAPAGYVQLAFDIDTTGHAENIRVVDSDPPELLDSAAIRQIANSSFRPRMRDGEIIEADSYFVWQFHYEPEGSDTPIAGFAEDD